MLRVRGIEGADDLTFGAHLHSGPCVAGDPAAALGHYNTDVMAGVTPLALRLTCRPPAATPAGGGVIPGSTLVSHYRDPRPRTRLVS